MRIYNQTGDIPSYWYGVPNLCTYLENSPRDDYIITLRIDGEDVNELLLYDGGTDGYTWYNDWDEGQKSVLWHAAIPVTEVTTKCPDTGDTGYVL